MDFRVLFSLHPDGVLGVHWVRNEPEATLMKNHEFVKGVLTAMIVSGLSLSMSAQPVTMTVDASKPREQQSAPRGPVVSGP